MEDGDRLSAEIAAVVQVFTLREKAQAVLLEALIRHLALNVPGFSGSRFLDELYIVQETHPHLHMQIQPGSTPQGSKLIDPWRHMIEIAERAVRDADELRRSR
jgi:hypothetical protein